MSFDKKQVSSALILLFANHLYMSCAQEKGSDKFVDAPKAKESLQVDSNDAKVEVKKETVNIAPAVTELVQDTDIEVHQTAQTGGDVQIEESAQSKVKNNPIAKEKPALALRASACIMCHANINANVIADFGHGDSFFFGGLASDPLTSNTIAHRSYSVWGWSGWTKMGAKIVGDIVVPKATITASTSGIFSHYFATELSKTAADSISLKTALTDTFYAANQTLTYLTLKNSQDAINKTFAQIDPGVYGTIKDKSKVYIGAPTKKDILDQTTGRQKLISDRGVSIWLGKDDSFSGFKIIGTNEGDSHLEINEATKCEGDVIISAVVHVNKAKIETSAIGCRLYVTETVFITDEVKFSGHENATAQISSASGIFVGVSANLEFRSEHAFPGTRLVKSAEAKSAMVNKLKSDRDRIKSFTDFDDAGPIRVSGSLKEGKVYGQWYDANNNKVATPSSVAWAGSNGRKEVNQAGLLLNAPMVHSRYFGQFKGIIIAEYPLFAVGKFSFTYDEKFNYVDFLPLVHDKVLVIEE